MCSKSRAIRLLSPGAQCISIRTATLPNTSKSFNALSLLSRASILYCCIDKPAISKPIHHEELRTLDMVRHQRCIGRTAQELYFTSVRIDDVTVFAIPRENASHETDVMKKACSNEVGVIAGRLGGK